jgi:hypothetical protein
MTSDDAGTFNAFASLKTVVMVGWFSPRSMSEMKLR